MSDMPIKINCRNCRSKYDVTDFPPFTEFLCPECGVVIRTPKRFGRYLLEKLCGKGGMSEIFRAIDPVLARRVAVKITPIDGDFAEMKDCFYHEAKLLAPVSHANILPIYDCGVIDNEAYIVMQYMDSGDFERFMKQKKLPELPQLLDYLRQIATGLQFLFANFNIVHHDVKPSNIMLNLDGEVKLGDFDLADVRNFGDITKQCPLWGSPGYVSPERMKFGGEDHRGDIYSLGITIYELLTGQTPFGIMGEPEELLQRRYERFTPLVKLRPEAGNDLSNLVGAMLSPEPDDRPGYQEVIRLLHL